MSNQNDNKVKFTVLNLSKYYSEHDFSVPTFLKSIIENLIERSDENQNVACEIKFHDDGFIEISDNAAIDSRFAEKEGNGYVPAEYLTNVLDLTYAAEVTISKGTKSYKFEGNYNRDQVERTVISTDAGSEGVSVVFKFIPEIAEGMRYVNYDKISEYLRTCSIFNRNINFTLSFRRDTLKYQLGFFDISPEITIINRSASEVIEIGFDGPSDDRYKIYFSLRDIHKEKLERIGFNRVSVSKPELLDKFYSTITSVFIDKIEDSSLFIDKSLVERNINVIMDYRGDINEKELQERLGDILQLKLDDISDTPDFADLVDHLMDRH
ncbi:hypothetical protein ABGV42_00270 [Paenibacillus pabuli]|uniref:hypothetical protein n=1 Tax=Paenibacillus pabuli TaxID=1472 RepID=UPI0032421E4A